MGNIAINVGNRLNPEGGGAKVILPDGTIEYYDKPLTVAELMLEHPQQMVIEYRHHHHQQQNKMIMKKAVAAAAAAAGPLAADKMLETGKVYVMLPMMIRRGKPAAAILSSQEARLLLLKANSLLLKSNNINVNSSSFISSTTGFIPLFASWIMCATGTTRSEERDQEDDHEVGILSTRRKMSLSDDDQVSILLMEERLRGGGPEYLSRQISGKAGAGGWKPSLDTITEKVTPVQSSKLRPQYCFF